MLLMACVKYSLWRPKSPYYWWRQEYCTTIHMTMHPRYNKLNHNKINERNVENWLNEGWYLCKRHLPTLCQNASKFSPELHVWHLPTLSPELWHLPTLCHLSYDIFLHFVTWAMASSYTLSPELWHLPTLCHLSYGIFLHFFTWAMASSYTLVA
jgi:hypothetical protein